MPEFRLRIWQEQILFDCADYLVTADSLSDAVALLEQQQEYATLEDRDVVTPGIVSADQRGLNEVRPLDPQEVVDGASGVTLIDEKGGRLRDLVGVPTGCAQLGEPV